MRSGTGPEATRGGASPWLVNVAPGRRGFYVVWAHTALRVGAIKQLGTEHFSPKLGPWVIPPTKLKTKKGLTLALHP